MRGRAMSTRRQVKCVMWGACVVSKCRLSRAVQSECTSTQSAVDGGGRGGAAAGPHRAISRGPVNERLSLRRGATGMTTTRTAGAPWAESTAPRSQDSRGRTGEAARPASGLPLSRRTVSGAAPMSRLGLGGTGGSGPLLPGGGEPSRGRAPAADGTRTSVAPSPFPSESFEGGRPRGGKRRACWRRRFRCRSSRARASVSGTTGGRHRRSRRCRALVARSPRRRRPCRQTPRADRCRLQPRWRSARRRPPPRTSPRPASSCGSSERASEGDGACAMQAPPTARRT